MNNGHDTPQHAPGKASSSRQVPVIIRPYHTLKSISSPAIPENLEPIKRISFPTIESADRLRMGREMVELYENIEALLPNLKHKVIQLVGSREREGTSTIALELAKACATRWNQSVLLIGLGEEGPSFEVFVSPDNPAWQADIEESTGLCHIGKNNSHLNSFNMVSGIRAEVSGQSGAFLKNLRNWFDLILIDSSPLDHNSDALGIVRKVDGVVLVVEAGKTRQSVARASADQIRRHGGRILGVALNKQRSYIPDFIQSWLPGSATPPRKVGA